MANVDRPAGFMPFGAVLRLNPYKAKGTIGRGDAVKRSAGSSDTDGKDEVVAGSAGAALIGVAAHKAVSGDEVLVYDHPDQEFLGQADDNSIATNADIGLNYSILATAASNGQSLMEIDASTKNTTATLEVKVLRLVPSVDNAIGTNCKVVFKINNHQLNGGTGVAGV